MDEKMTWYILRHAEKERGEYYNPNLRHQDEPINRTGLEHAERLIEYFVDKEISKIYISAYLRTKQTSAPLARHFNLVPVVDERLNEVDNGLFEGMTEEDVKQKYPGEWQAYRKRRADFRFPGGETGEEARDRIANFLDEKCEPHGDENIVIVSHDGLIRVMMCHLMKLPVTNRWDFRVDFCGITEISYQPDYGTWKLIRFNQIFG
jgi:broad specificity phosphatase PhoE